MSRTSTTQPQSDLSEREQKVLELASEGLVDREIAERLGLSIHTVRTYWDRIRTKVGASSRLELATTLLRSDLDSQRQSQQRTMERLRAENLAVEQQIRELRAEAEALKTVLRHSPGLVFGASPEGQLFFLSESFEALTGVSVERALAGDWPDVIHPDDYPHLVQAAGKSLLFAAPLCHTFRMRLAGGEYRRFEIMSNPVFDASGALTMWSGMCADVEQIETGARGVSQPPSFSAAFDEAPFGVMALDAAGNLSYSNRALAALVGEDSERWLEAVIPADRDRLASEWRRLSKIGGIMQESARFVRPEGGEVPVRVRAWTLKDGERYLGTLAFFDENPPAGADLHALAEALIRKLNLGSAVVAG